jgi:hypothetical protein
MKDSRTVWKLTRHALEQMSQVQGKLSTKKRTRERYNV